MCDKQLRPHTMHVVFVDFVFFYWEVIAWEAIIHMANECEPEAQQMCADIKAHGRRAERKTGGVYHSKAGTIAGYVKARQEFPEETKPDKKVIKTKLSKQLHGQTNKEL